MNLVSSDMATTVVIIKTKIKPSSKTLWKLSLVYTPNKKSIYSRKCTENKLVGTCVIEIQLTSHCLALHERQSISSEYSQEGEDTSALSSKSRATVTSWKGQTSNIYYLLQCTWQRLNSRIVQLRGVVICFFT